MRNNPLNNDPQTIWQNQITETVNMSATQFMEKAEQRRARARWLVIVHDLTYIAFLVLLGFEYMRNADITWRIGSVLLAVGALYVTYRGHRYQWPESLSSDGPPAAGLEVYRRELLRSRDYARNIWPMLGPLIPGCIVIAFPALIQIARAAVANPAILINAVPFCVLFAVWLTIFIPVRRRRILKLQGEIEMLNRLAGSTPH
ncbi:MAG: hypothetical protein ABSH09_25835 [Bryobacteraceae bacterium]